mmetsp:Transcript_15764/g.30884  ORF Transcript_15764/g.30884 Transcript_15764/m.30884 type:complete len:296 (+) Transcript_15764:55-942(+)
MPEIHSARLSTDCTMLCVVAWTLVEVAFVAGEELWIERGAVAGELEEEDKGEEPVEEGGLACCCSGCFCSTCVWVCCRTGSSSSSLLPRALLLSPSLMPSSCTVAEDGDSKGLFGVMFSFLRRAALEALVLLLEGAGLVITAAEEGLATALSSSLLDISSSLLLHSSLLRFDACWLAVILFRSSVAEADEGDNEVGREPELSIDDGDKGERGDSGRGATECMDDGDVGDTTIELGCEAFSCASCFWRCRFATRALAAAIRWSLSRSEESSSSPISLPPSVPCPVALPPFPVSTTV